MLRAALRRLAAAAIWCGSERACGWLHVGLAPTAFRDTSETIPVRRGVRLPEAPSEAVDAEVNLSDIAHPACGSHVLRADVVTAVSLGGSRG